MQRASCSAELPTMAMEATFLRAVGAPAKVLQVAGVNEYRRRCGALHGLPDGACKHAAAALVMAQRVPKRLFTVSHRITWLLTVAVSTDSAMMAPTRTGLPRSSRA